MCKVVHELPIVLHLTAYTLSEHWRMQIQISFDVKRVDDAWTVHQFIINGKLKYINTTVTNLPLIDYGSSLTNEMLWIEWWRKCIESEATINYDIVNTITQCHLRPQISGLVYKQREPHYQYHLLYSSMKEKTKNDH